MAALPLLAFMLLHATQAERAVIEAAVAARVWSGPDFIVLGRPDPEEDRLHLRARAEHAFAAILARISPLLDATALDTETLQLATFPLKILRGREHEVDWPAGQWRKYEAIGIEEGEIAAPSASDALGRTGAPGRPPKNSMYLVQREFERRAKQGQLPEQLAELASELRQWAIENHPELPPPTPKYIKNTLRRPYREARSKGRPKL